MTERATKAMTVEDVYADVREVDEPVGDSQQSKMDSVSPSLVKGFGFVHGVKNKVNGKVKLTELDDPDVILERSFKMQESIKDWSAAAKMDGQAVVAGNYQGERPQASHKDKSGKHIFKGVAPDFRQFYGGFLSAVGGGFGFAGWMQQVQTALASLGKAITTTSPLGTGVVPYDLVAPSRLIYPVYSPYRNKFPRPAGQGLSRRAKLFTGIQGSQTGVAAKRVTIAELPGGGSLTSTNWPNQLPPQGTQAANDLTIPYKFMGLTEALTWLAQFAGQGFEDISALANLILLQEMMLGEEFQLLSGTNTNITAPTIASATARSAGTGETAITGATTNVFIKASAVNYFGETAGGAATAAVAVTNGTSVVDVVINPVRGAFGYNLYVSTGAGDPGDGSRFLVSPGTQGGIGTGPPTVGGVKFTLQGALPTTVAVLGADSGTGNANDFEGIQSILSGHAATDAAVYPTSPLFAGGYFNGGIGGVLNTALLFNVLAWLFDKSGTGTNNGSPGFRADPAELVAAFYDVINLTNDLLSKANAGTNFTFFIDQDEIGSIRAGAAVSQFQNPGTRSLIRIMVHPFLQQGNAHLLSYTMPATYTNIANIWENIMVQDYLSVSWPVIDPTFRYSIFLFGALVCYAPQYNALMAGLQKSATTPYS